MKPEHMKASIDEMNKKSLRFLHEHDNHHDHDHHHHDHHHDDHHHDDHHDHDNNNLKKDNHNLKTGDIDHRKWDSAARSQGGCGSCWAFAAIGAIENQYHNLMGKMTLFSEQHLVDCDNMDGGCNGGWPTNTFNWIKANGIIKLNNLKYQGSAGSCDSSLKPYEYNIVKGAKAFSKDSPFAFNNNWDALLAQGPLVVAMDASFQGFGAYRPESFEALAPITCGNINHAVVAVGKVTENGTEYLLVRNSWGEDWGYKGYFKITRSTNCSITEYGWLPEVYNGKVPSSNPEPIPEPKSDDCVELFGWSGFNSAPIQIACDSVTELDDYFFYGVKFPTTTLSGRQIKLMAFPWRGCGGDWKMPIEQTTEYIERNGDTAYTASLAFIKEAKAGCINFYTETCNKGDAAFTICEDIKDTQLVNFSQLPQVKSLLPDGLAINRITFHTLPNYEGDGIEISGDALYDVDSNWRLGYNFEKGNIRSVKIHRN